MVNAGSPKSWNLWFRDGTIYETEFFHGLIACASQFALDEILALLSGEERRRFEKMVRQLVSLDELLEGQAVTSVARYDLATVRDLLKQLEVRSDSE